MKFLTQIKVSILTFFALRDNEEFDIVFKTIFNQLIFKQNLLTQSIYYYLFDCEKKTFC